MGYKPNDVCICNKCKHTICYVKLDESMTDEDKNTEWEVSIIKCIGYIFTSYCITSEDYLKPINSVEGLLEI